MRREGKRGKKGKERERKGEKGRERERRYFGRGFTRETITGIICKHHSNVCKRLFSWRTKKRGEEKKKKNLEGKEEEKKKKKKKNNNKITLKPFSLLTKRINFCVILMGPAVLYDPEFKSASYLWEMVWKRRKGKRKRKQNEREK